MSRTHPSPNASSDVPNAPSAPMLRRSLEELAGSERFQKLLEQEFSEPLGDSPDHVTRRSFLALMGASLALAGATGCRPPREEIVPRVSDEHAWEASRPRYFATAMPLSGYATGLLVEQRDGRPIKIEGNPDHPASLGATDLFAQASILSLYDPHRSRFVLHHHKRTTWERARAALESVLARLRRRGGAGLGILTESISSPTLAAQLDLLQSELSETRIYCYEPVTLSAIHEGTELALGRAAETIYQFDNADIIVSLDADFLGTMPGHLRYARQFTSARRVWNAQGEPRMNRLYAASPTPDLTWAAADDRISVRPSQVHTLALALAARFGLLEDPDTASLAPSTLAWLDRVERNLRDSTARRLVVAGPYQPPAVHAVVSAINDHLGSPGQSLHYIPPVLARPATTQSLLELTRDLENGSTEALLVVGGNPAYAAPADLQLADLIARVPFSLHLGVHANETTRCCQWHVPEAHYLESWGDARTYDGTVSLIQPLVQTLYGGHTALELVSLVRRPSADSDYEQLRAYWRAAWQLSGEDFERAWHRALHDGVVAGTAFEPLDFTLRETWRDELEPPPPVPSDRLEIAFRPDPTIYDGRFADNAWLQELPKPISKLTWENAVLMSPSTAATLGLKEKSGERGGDLISDVAQLTYRDQQVDGPTMIMPGQADGTVTVLLGYGRSVAGPVAKDRGYSAYRLRHSDQPWSDSGLLVGKTGRRQRLAATQLHHLMQGRDLVRSGTLEQYRQQPDAIAKNVTSASRRSLAVLPILGETGTDGAVPVNQRSSMYPEHPYNRYRWGMVIDLTSCLGCSACVIACQAENNTPVVGREEVLRGREMHWLRIDAYHSGRDAGIPEATYFQPVPCMHCEKAPCEVVCPVNATVHSDEGLNDMNYARCVGTRYCSNNCPYKVRRFNYFEYSNWETESFKAMRNPDVTVRSRGVIEKCTYCVQRINRARIEAELSDRPLVRNRAGEWIKPIYENELLTACQAACPADAIVFGDLNDPTSRVSQMRFDQPLNYGLLHEELGTQPRTTYLAALRNPPPEKSDDES